MPVVSQSITRPMVPVGATTVACAVRAGRGHHGGVRVGVAVLVAERERAVAGPLGMLDQARIRAGGVVEPHRRGRDLLVAGLVAARGAAVIADHAQHVLAVLLVTREGPELG